MYIVAYVSLFDNQMIFTKVDAASPVKALIQVFDDYFEEFDPDDVDSVIQHLFNCDVVAGVYEL